MSQKLLDIEDIATQMNKLSGQIQQKENVQLNLILLQQLADSKTEKERQL